MKNYYWPYVANLWSYSIGNNMLDFRVQDYIKACQPASGETTTQCIYYSLCGRFIQETVRENTASKGDVFHVTLVSDRIVKTFVGIMSNEEISFSYVNGTNLISNIVNCRTLQELMYFLVTTMVININYQIIFLSTSPFEPIDTIYNICAKLNRMEDYHETMSMVN